MLGKKSKSKNVRNILESPFHLKWTEKSADEIIPIKNALKELLPDAKLEKVVFCNKKLQKKISDTKCKNDGSIKQRQNNIFRQYLALGFQSVIRGLEKKELCCVILAGNITPLLQKVVLTHSQLNNVPITIIPDLKNVTTTALGFATMVLGFKTAVADATNKFYPIYRLVSTYPIYFGNVSSKQNEDVVDINETVTLRESCESHIDSEDVIDMDESKTQMGSSKSYVDTEDIYLYRNQSGERAFIPRFKTEDSDEIVCKKEGQPLENFISLSQSSDHVRQPIVECNINMKHTLSSEDSDDNNIFFIDKTQDVSLLSKQFENNSKNGKSILQCKKKNKFKKKAKNGISFNMCNTNQADVSNSSIKLHQNIKCLNKNINKVEKHQQTSSNTYHSFNPLKIKTITNNPKKIKIKKKNNKKSK